MPRYSSIGFNNQIAHVVKDHVFAPSEAIASLAAQPAANPAGLRVTLPGPVSTPDAMPEDGDIYGVMDPGMLADSSHGVIIDFGGSTFNGSTAAVGPSTIGPIVLWFAYDAKQGAWSLSE